MNGSGVRECHRPIAGPQRLTIQKRQNGVRRYYFGRLNKIYQKGSIQCLMTPLIDGHEKQADFEAEIQAEADQSRPLTPEQITQLTNDPKIKATIEANKIKAIKARESDLMLLGYNEALLDNHQWPQGHTSRTWADVIEMQKAKLGIE